MFEDISGGGATGAAIAAPPAAPPSADSAASPAAASVAASAAASPESPNIKQLREQYETTKTKLEPWEKNFQGVKPEDVAVAHTAFSQMNKEALELGSTLGYDANEVRQFMRTDPVAVLNHLRQKAADSQKGPVSPADIRKMVEQAANERLKPFEQERERHTIATAMQKFDGEFDRLVAETYKDGLPDEAREALKEMCNAMTGEDAEACKALRAGKVVGVQKHFAAANARIQKIFTAMLAQERKRTGTGNSPETEKTVAGKKAMDKVLSTGQKVSDLYRI